LRIGKSKYFVMEACEYDRSFLDFKPSILILTNIEEEHLDTYPGGLSEIMDAFSEYIKKIRQGGTIIANRADDNVVKLMNNIQHDVNLIWYGEGSERYSKLDFELSLSGDHNKSNALAVLALADLLKVDHSAVKKVFASFKGAKRRMEYWGELNQSLLYDDYGHHPTEIKATIQAFKEKFPDRKLIVIFWPHQYKRIMPLFDKFVESFKGADHVLIKDIFFVPGRDQILDVSSADMAKAVTEREVSAGSFSDNSDIIPWIKEMSREKCVFLTIGIPPIYKLWQEIIGE